MIIIITIVYTGYTHILMKSIYLVATFISISGINS